MNNNNNYHYVLIPILAWLIAIFVAIKEQNEILQEIKTELVNMQEQNTQK